jgi:hypothetical protein
MKTAAQRSADLLAKGRGAIRVEAWGAKRFECDLPENARLGRAGQLFIARLRNRSIFSCRGCGRRHSDQSNRLDAGGELIFRCFLGVAMIPKR